MLLLVAAQPISVRDLTLWMLRTTEGKIPAHGCTLRSRRYALSPPASPPAGSVAKIPEERRGPTSTADRRVR
eukprot:2222679-Rhodomonas_salina.1